MFICVYINSTNTILCWETCIIRLALCFDVFNLYSILKGKYCARLCVLRNMAKDEDDDKLPDKDAAKEFYAKYEPKEILGR